MDEEFVVVENELALALHDAFPVTPGHILVVPRRHVADYFGLTPEEQGAVWDLVNRVREQSAMDSEPDGYNLGVNVGSAAGQTVEHTHIHVIPRRLGDTDDPRGGIRWVIPDRAPYWKEQAVSSRRQREHEE